MKGGCSTFVGVLEGCIEWRLQIARIPNVSGNVNL